MSVSFCIIKKTVFAHIENLHPFETPNLSFADKKYSDQNETFIVVDSKFIWINLYIGTIIERLEQSKKLLLNTIFWLKYIDRAIVD